MKMNCSSLPHHQVEPLLALKQDFQDYFQIKPLQINGLKSHLELKSRAILYLFLINNQIILQDLMRIIVSIIQEHIRMLGKAINSNKQEDIGLIPTELNFQI